MSINNLFLYVYNIHIKKEGFFMYHFNDDTIELFTIFYSQSCTKYFLSYSNNIVTKNV